MELEVVQAVQEFSNKEGGVVVIGVQDDPRVVKGIERDFPYVQPSYADGLTLFISDLLTNKLGPNRPVRRNRWIPSACLSGTITNRSLY